jgi:hypothetical protein
MRPSPDCSKVSRLLASTAVPMVELLPDMDTGLGVREVIFIRYSFLFTNVNRLLSISNNVTEVIKKG